MDTTNTDQSTDERVQVQREKLKVSGKKIADVVKGVAVAYVGFQLGVLALKFIGRRLSGGKRRPVVQPSRQQRTQSYNAPPAAPVSEDCWAAVDAPAPDTPPGYKPIANAVLPCSPQELYSVLFSGSGTELYLKQHREIGKQWDLVASGWRRAPMAAAAAGSTGGAAAGRAGGDSGTDGSLLGQQTVFEYVLSQPGSGSFTRLLTFWNPKKPPSTVDTRCVQRQQFCVYRDGSLVFATAMNMLDIPFKDCFTVNTLWRVVPGAAHGTCALTISLKVHFIKRAMGVGGIISATTFRDSAAFFQAFTAAVDAHLRALRLQAAAPLPAPLPLPAGGPTGTRGARSAPSRPASQLVSPFAAASGALPPPPSAAAAGPVAATSAQQRAPVPAWRQIRALLVLTVLAFTLLHQLHLGREIAAMRGDGTAGDGSRGGDGGGGGLAAQAGGLLAAALGPVATATGSLHLVLQALVDRVGGRG